MGENASFMVQAKKEMKVFPRSLQEIFPEHYNAMWHNEEAQRNVQEGLVVSSRFVSLVNQVPHSTMFCIKL